MICVKRLSTAVDEKLVATLALLEATDIGWMIAVIAFRQSLEAGHTTVLSAQGTVNWKGSGGMEEQERRKEMEDNGLSAEDSDCVHICNSFSLEDPLRASGFQIPSLFSVLAQFLSLLHSIGHSWETQLLA